MPSPVTTDLSAHPLTKCLKHPRPRATGATRLGVTLTGSHPGPAAIWLCRRILGRHQVCVVRLSPAVTWDCAPLEVRVVFISCEARSSAASALPGRSARGPGNHADTLDGPIWSLPVTREFTVTSRAGVAQATLRRSGSRRQPRNWLYDGRAAPKDSAGVTQVTRWTSSDAR